MLSKSLLVALPILFLLPESASAQKPMMQTGERQFCRVLFFDQVDGQFAIPCQYMIEYGAPEWKDEYDGLLDKQANGSRFRLGKDAWTTFETNRKLTVGGVVVAPGHYHAVAEKTGDKEISLVLLDSATVRKDHMDPFQSPTTKGGIVIPLKWEKADKASDSLVVRMNPSKENAKHSTLVLAFGPHRFSAAISAEF